MRKITLEGGFDGWTDGLFAQGGFFPADLTIEIVLEAQRLYAVQQRGTAPRPADRGSGRRRNDLVNA